MKNKTRYTAFGLLAVLVAIAIRCGSSEVVEAPVKVIPVKMTKVMPESVAVPVHASGMLYSKQQIRLSFKTGGVIDRIVVQEGQSVKKGAELARLELDEIEAKVEQARNGFDKAQRDFQRVKKLYDEGAATLEQLQNVETQLNVARSNVRIAEYNLTHSVIKAPAHGRILKKLAEEHEIVGPGQPVFYFGAGGRQWVVRAGLSDREIVRVNLGDRARVSFDAFPGVEFPARITEIARAADPQTGVFEIELLLEDNDLPLAAGFVARVEITPGEHKESLLIPVSALTEANGDRGVVFVIEADTVRRVEIAVGDLVGDKIVVRHGLKAGTRLATEGAAYLKTGDHVRMISEQQNQHGN